MLGTTDVQMNLLPNDDDQDKQFTAYNVTRPATLIKAARAEEPDNLRFDTGDRLQGNPIARHPDGLAQSEPVP